MINISSSAPQSSTPQSNVPPTQAVTQATPQQTASQPLEQPVDQNKKNNNKYFLIGGILLAILAIGGLISLFLINKPQDIRQQAAQCVEACPNSQNPSLLQSCTPPESDGSSADSLCNSKGRVEVCGNVNYCCPAPGGTWTTNMTACATPTPIPSPTDEPGLCSSDSVADCRTLDPGDYCNNGAGECTADGTTGSDGKDVCTCPAPTTEPTTEPTAVPTTEPTATPTTAPTDTPNATTAPTSAATTAPTTAPTSMASATTAPTQPPLPSQLPETGPADWLKNLTIGLGVLGVGALLFLFL